MAPQLKHEASIEAIIAEMTIEEKAEMIQGGSPFRSAAMPKYGIPAIYIPFKGKRPDFDLRDAFAVTERAAQEGIVLLKNDGTLPLSNDEKVVFYGKRSKQFVIIPASVAASTDLATNPFEAAAAIVRPENVRFEDAADSKTWIVTVGADAREGIDREDMEMDADDRQALEKAIMEAEAAGGRVVLIINATGPVELSDYVDRVNAIVSFASVCIPLE